MNYLDYTQILVEVISRQENLASSRQDVDEALGESANSASDFSWAKEQLYTALKAHRDALRIFKPEADKEALKGAEIESSALINHINGVRRSVNEVILKNTKVGEKIVVLNELVTEIIKKLGIPRDELCDLPEALPKQQSEEDKIRQENAELLPPIPITAVKMERPSMPPERLAAASPRVGRPPAAPKTWAAPRPQLKIVKSPVPIPVPVTASLPLVGGVKKNGPLVSTEWRPGNPILSDADYKASILHLHKAGKVTATIEDQELFKKLGLLD